MRFTRRWDEIFAEAHLHSWPTASLMISKVSPAPDQGSREIFQEDKTEIMAAAARHGYTLILETRKAAHFVRRLP